uniref:Uncharacterized protein n=1 Tax=Plectus sambesii TaxID=2011161 RepID=A0A914USL5_9BILA
MATRWRVTAAGNKPRRRRRRAAQSSSCPVISPPFDNGAQSRAGDRDDLSERGDRCGHAESPGDGGRCDSVGFHVASDHHRRHLADWKPLADDRSVSPDVHLHYSRTGGLAIVAQLEVARQMASQRSNDKSTNQRPQWRAVAVPNWARCMRCSSEMRPRAAAAAYRPFCARADAICRVPARRQKCLPARVSDGSQLRRRRDRSRVLSRPPVEQMPPM